LSRTRQKEDVGALEEAIGHRFRDRDLLLEALTHKSFHHENKDLAPVYNERLEFLGDSVAGLVIVEHLFSLKQGYSEATLAKMKSYLACEGVMADIAAGIAVEKFLLLGKGEESTGGRKKRSILADALEALVGAVYLDGGLDAARPVVHRLFGEKIAAVVESGEFYDYKTELQERSQSLYGTLPEYRVIRQEGEDHQRVFTVAVYLNGKQLATASGGRIKEAEAQAARKALSMLRG